MSKRILSGVSVGGKVYAAGQEDELEAVLSEGQCAHLLAEKAIEGDWSPGGEPPMPAKRSRAFADAGTDQEDLKAAAELHDKERLAAAEARLKAAEEAEAAEGGETTRTRRTRKKAAEESAE